MKAVVGGRDCSSLTFLDALDWAGWVLSELGFVTGDCKIGADYFARKYDPVKVFEAEWEKYGKSAGPRRNKELVKFIAQNRNPTLLAIWDGESSGTGSTIKFAREAKVPTMIYYYE